MNSILNMWNTFMSLDNKKKRRLYYVFFTIAFLIFSACVFSFYYRNDKSFIWIGGAKDGLSQHINCLVYYSKYLREAAGTIFIDHSLNLPNWDFAIGYGADVLTTMSFITVGDFLNLFSVFVPEDEIPLFFNFLAIFRLYLAGIAFSMYCFKMERSHKAVLISSFVYLFCGFTIFALPRHPFFINPMIYLPLMLLGVEKIFRKEKPYVFTIVVALTLINNFYFFFMIVLLSIVYIVIRFFTLHKQDYIKHSWVYVRSFLVYGILGSMLSCFLFLPILLRFFADARGGSAVSVDLFYSIDLYKKVIPAFISWQNPGFWTFLSYGPIGFLGITALFMNRKKFTPLKIGFLLLTIFLLLPFFGHVFNGLSYVINRWVFGYSFLIALILTYTIPKFFTMNRKDIVKILVCTLLYLLACAFISNMYWKDGVLAFVPIIGIIIVLYIVNLKKFQKYRVLLLTFSFGGLTLFGAVNTAYACYAPHKGNSMRDFLKAGTEIAHLKDNNSIAVKALKDPSFYRYGEPSTGKSYFYNSGLNSGLSSPNYFFSFSNANAQEFYGDVKVGDGSVLFIPELDSRTILNTLSSTKYFAIQKDQKSWVPYGFQQVKLPNEGKYEVYENKYFLPLGYTYDTYISTQDYKQLSAMQKQEALLQSVVTDVDLPAYPQTNKVKSESYTLPAHIKANKNVEIKEGVFIVKKANSTIEFEFDEVKDAELYLSLDKVSFKAVNFAEYFSDERKANMSKKDKQDAKNWTPASSSIITIEAGVGKGFVVRTPDDSYFNPRRTDLMANLGYRKEGRHKIIVKFQRTGEYRFQTPKVEVLRMNQYAANVDKLKENVLENINMTTDKITGSINLDRNKILNLTIPYTDGWTAKVDGKPVEILRGNIMFMAIPLEAGTHDLELSYQTPGLKVGIMISLVGVGALCALIFTQKKLQNDKRKRNI